MAPALSSFARVCIPICLSMGQSCNNLQYQLPSSLQDFSLHTEKRVSAECSESSKLNVRVRNPARKLAASIMPDLLTSLLPILQTMHFLLGHDMSPAMTVPQNCFESTGYIFCLPCPPWARCLWKRRFASGRATQLGCPSKLRRRTF